MKWAKASDLGLFQGAVDPHPAWKLQLEQENTPVQWPPKVSSAMVERERRAIIAGADTGVIVLRKQPRAIWSLARRDAFRKRVSDAQGGYCFWCEREMNLTVKVTVSSGGKVKNNPKFATFEHFKKREHGGRLTYDNTVAACGQCNWKRDRPSMKNHPRYQYTSIEDRRAQLLAKRNKPVENLTAMAS